MEDQSEGLHHHVGSMLFWGHINKGNISMGSINPPGGFNSEIPSNMIIIIIISGSKRLRPRLIPSSDWTIAGGLICRLLINDRRADPLPAFPLAHSPAVARGDGVGQLSLTMCLMGCSSDSEHVYACVCVSSLYRRRRDVQNLRRAVCMLVYPISLLHNNNNKNKKQQ